MLLRILAGYTVTIELHLSESVVGQTVRITGVHVAGVYRFPPPM